MKSVVMILFFLLTFGGAVIAQKAPKFAVSVSTDSVLLGHYFQVKFTLENASGKDFQAPAFPDFQVVSGPNMASSVSIVNGEMSQTVSYTYYLEPKDIGNFYIQPASIRIENDVLETLPITVMVVPNPDGIIQKQEMSEKFSFDLQMPDKRPRSNPAPAPKKEEPATAPKRKIYKM